jgi:hypothetical protein
MAIKRDRRVEKRHAMKGAVKYRVVKLPPRAVVRERRKFVRHTVKGPVNYRVIRLPSPEEMVKLLDAMRSGAAHDISKGGICFRSSQLLLPGTLVEMDLPRTPVCKAGRKLARVKWVQELSPNSYRVGVKFA